MEGVSRPLQLQERFLRAVRIAFEPADLERLSDLLGMVPIWDGERVIFTTVEDARDLLRRNQE